MGLELSERCGGRAPWLLAAVAAGAVALERPAEAQDVRELLRARVEQLRDTGALDVGGVPIAARTLIPKIYEAREFAPAWRSAEQVDALLEVVDDSFLDGLDPRDYHAEAVRAARGAFERVETLAPAERAGLDLLLTDSVIRLGYHLRFGKVDPVALDSAWNMSRELVDQDPVETIQAAIDAPSMRAFAAQVIPRNFLYRRLKAALADYRAIAERGGWPAVDAGPTLKVGVSDPRVPALRQRLAITGDLDAAAVASGADAALYDADVAAAVVRFQERHGLATDGAVGRRTLAALNVPVEQRIGELRANLERARWVMGDLGDEFVIVNIAGFRLYVVRGDEVVWRTRVVVGRTYRRTPVFKAELRYLVFNPTWTVPPTIFREDILPELRRDPGYLAAHQIDLVDAAGSLVDPFTVDWSARRGFPYDLVQRPGPENPLGRVKFMFPNEHLVYLHDTPSRELFERESRAFSSGCIRVENPLELVELLLGRRSDRERVDTLIATGRTETVFLDEPVDLLLLYWTTEVDEQGRVYFWPDLYARDAAVIEQLNAPFRGAGVL
jgi:murein L,D-transpeptidase YcbB/YkuD